MIYWLMAYIAKIFFRVIYLVKFVGKENIPKDKNGYIMCSNHKSVADPIMLCIPFKRRLYYMAKSELFTNHGKLADKFLRSLGAFPVHRDKVDINSISTAEELLRSNKIVAIFPQGACISGDDFSFKAKSGATLLSAQTKSRILPVSIYSEGKIKPFKKITVRIGKIIEWSELGFKDGTLKESRNATKILSERIINQLSKKHNKV